MQPFFAKKYARPAHCRDPRNRSAPPKEMDMRMTALAMEFFQYVSSAFAGGIRVVEVLRQSGGGNTFVCEFRDEGTLRGEPYKNRVAISLDVCGDKICGYREYFGSDGKIN